MWYWCRKQEEYELQDFTEIQQSYQGGGQDHLDRIDENFPELLSFDNIQGPQANGHVYSATMDSHDRIIRENNDILYSAQRRHLSV